MQGRVRSKNRVGFLWSWCLWMSLGLVLPSVPSFAAVQGLVRQETRADQAESLYGVSGAGVTVVVLDRGITIQNRDFRNPDGTTRIKWMLDMSGSNWCAAGNPAPVEYSEAEINAALTGGPSIAMRDAVGHGDATAGMAAGNGRSLPGAPFRGMAPEADLIVVKVTSEGAPAHGSELSEAAFNGCIDDAFDWLDGKIDALGQPAVAILNSGTQWGPIDGTATDSSAPSTRGGPRRRDGA
jgi:minor extracellular serine protease Vpr